MCIRDSYRTVLERRLARGDDPASDWSLSVRRSFADAARSAGRLEEAERAYRTVLKTHAATRASPPGVPSIRARLAWTVLDRNRPGEALREALAARRGVPDGEVDALVECVLARAFRANGRVAEADSVVALAAARLAETGYPVRDYHPCWGLTAATSLSGGSNPPG